jgi:hypothetical protein
MAKENETVMVPLKSKDFAKGKSAKKQSFPIGQANKILGLSNSQWELDSKDFDWNGKEIVKVKK